ncbi:MAG: hypothetical protein ACOC3J_01610, partial [Gemmatimonadota bacterium]
MKRPIAAAVAAALSVSACDLPTSADEARARLGADQAERVIPIHLPLPEISATLADPLGELSELVDTTDLSLRTDPDTFSVGLGPMLDIGPVDPAPVTRAYELAVADFDRTIATSLPAVPVTLDGLRDSVPLHPAMPAGELPPLRMDLSGSFASATFAAGSRLEVALETDATAGITHVTARLQADGAVITTSGAPALTLSGGQRDTLVMDLAGRTLPAAVDLVLSYDGASGDGSSDELRIETGFRDAEVTAATAVSTARVAPVSFVDTVPLDVSGPDFSRATMAAGQVEVTDFEAGTLVFAPTFDGDLAGRQVGGAGADELVVSGTVGPPDAPTVDIETGARLVAAFTGLDVASATLNAVSMELAQSVEVPTDPMLDGLARVTLASGTLDVAVTNRLDVTGDVTLELAGVTNGGAAVTRTFRLAGSPDGAPVTTTVTVDLAGAVLEPALLAPTVTGTVEGADVTVTREAAAEAVVVATYLELAPSEVVLAGVPELSVAMDERVALTADDIDLGELADVMAKITFNEVSFSVVVDNGTGLDLGVSDFRMTLLDAGGQPVTTALGDTAHVALSADAALTG